MKPSTKCVEVCAHFEGFSAKPYLCPAKVPTIGYGTTVYPWGQKVSIQDKPVPEIIAREYMTFELNQKALEVEKMLQVPVDQHQFDSLVSFAYNCGSTALKGSTLLKLINGGILKKSEWKIAITNEFNKWVNGGGKKLPGLVSRRATEAFLFCENQIKYFKTT